MRQRPTSWCRRRRRSRLQPLLAAAARRRRAAGGQREHQQRDAQRGHQRGQTDQHLQRRCSQRRMRAALASATLGDERAAQGQRCGQLRCATRVAAPAELLRRLAEQASPPSVPPTKAYCRTTTNAGEQGEAPARGDRFEHCRSPTAQARTGVAHGRSARLRAAGAMTATRLPAHRRARSTSARRGAPRQQRRRGAEQHRVARPRQRRFATPSATGPSNAPTGSCRHRGTSRSRSEPPPTSSAGARRVVRETVRRASAAPR